jgi:hypothetical protein
VSINLDPAVVAEAVFEARSRQLEEAARAVIGDSEYFTAGGLETLTGTPKSTWRYWASIGQGPASSLLGRRRVWARASVIRWLIEQEQVAS